MEFHYNYNLKNRLLILSLIINKFLYLQYNNGLSKKYYIYFALIIFY